jgi:hypothetical protein
MNVSGISNYDYLSSIFGIQSTDESQTSTQASATSYFQTTGDQANISPMGQLMSSLGKLQSTDSTKFKKVAQQISNDLTDQAESSTDPMQAKMLTDMAANFATAAQTGNMASLAPKGPPPPPPSGTDEISGDKTSGNSTMSTAESVIAKDLAAATGQSYSLSGSSAASNANTLGDMMQLLNQLQTTDPEKFKQLTKQISEDLAAKAKNSTDEGESEMLTNMSKDFAEASSTGSTSSLKPKGHQGHHHRHGSSAGSTGLSQTSSETQTGDDPMSILNSILTNDLSGLTASTATNVSASA